MPAPKLLAGLPKPALFGLYGAIGGLLGALAFGEPAWALLKPPAAEPVTQIGVSASVSVQAYPATTNTFVIQVVRERFDGPVAVKFTGVPSIATIESLTIPAGQTQATATVSTSPIAVPGTSRITATAEGGGATATTAFDLVIASAPPPPPRLAVAVAPNLLVYKRGACQFSVQVARAGFDDRVLVTFDSLPSGVEIPPVVVERGKMEAEVTLRATDAAALGKSKLTATAEANAIRSVAQTELVVANPPARPADIMFVLDCTASMEPFIDGVKDGIRDFVSELNSKQIDARLGLLAFRDRIFGQEPELLTFEKQSPFTTDTKLFADKVGKLRCIGNNTIPESSLDGTVEAAGQPFRQGAARVLLLITDAPPLIPDKTTQTMKEAVDGLRDKKIDLLHIVVRKADRRIYERLQEGTSSKGKFFDLDRVRDGGEKFATILPELSREIANTVAARPLKAEVAPAPPPPVIPAAAAAAPIAADVPPAPAVKSLQSNEQAAAGSEGRLILRSGAWAGAIAALVCLALLAGQHHYLRGSLPPLGGAAAGLFGGLAVGVVGGAAGQGLFLLAQNSEALGIAFRVLGWALLGGSAGVGLSLFIPNMRWVYGLAGGALGGALGAAGFLAVAAITSDLVGRLMGGLLLGLCIGMMVAVVEAAFRRAWLQVRFGARETITVNLGPEPVKVGGDARVCTVWARGAAPLALRYFIRNGQVICEDAVMKRETAVGEGFAKELGNVTVTVRTGSAAAPTAPTSPRPVAPKPVPAKRADDFDSLPMPLASGGAAQSARPTAQVQPPVVAKPPVPLQPAGGGTAPARPAVAAPVAPKPVAKHPDGCPTCGRANAGAPGSRYCVVCDQTY